MKLAVALLITALAAAQPPSFPGAEGFGSATPGGRGGKVLTVTTLADSGPGSLREAIQTRGPRIVVFRVAGIIDLKKALIVSEPFLTIAGQTAPGDGICLRGANFGIRTHDVIVRFLRSRLGDVSKQEDDAISIASGAKNVILDHCSASWSVDESLSPSGEISDITVQWCIIAESLNKSVHHKGKHGYGSLLRAQGGVTMHHNLWADHTARNPRPGDNYGRPPYPTYDLRNNVIYNYGGTCTGLTDGKIKVNYVGNYIKPGPDSTARSIVSLSDNATAETMFYLQDNFIEGRPEWTKDPAHYFFNKTVGKFVSIASSAFQVPQVKTTSAREAFEEVLQKAGATLPVRDAVDRRIVDTVRRNTGKILDSQNQVGGWPEYKGGPPHDKLPSDPAEVERYINGLVKP